MVKQHENILDFSKTATSKCHGAHIILRLCETTKKLACWETESK